MKEEKRTKIDDNEICIKGIDEVPMFSWNTKTKEFYVLGHKFDGINSIEDFINYIHNLDKENKSLQSQLKAKEEENEQLKADYGNLAQVERDFLKEVIKEAREYIKEHIRIDDEYPAYMEMLITERDELYEILSKGENKWKVQ